MRVLAHSHPDDAAVEALRSLQTALHFAILESPNNVIALTGPSPNLGKSFITANLAAVMAGSKKRVVVVDADLRKGHLHEYVALSRAPGLSDFIAGNADLEAVVRPTSIDHMFVVSTGTLPPNPAELLMHERFTAFVNEISSRFDHVLIDPLRAIAESVRRLRQGGLDVRGCIFNQVGVRGHHYRYSYQYRYAPEGAKKPA
jgi:tyrosine-protein kinase Etk/Wzc